MTDAGTVRRVGRRASRLLAVTAMVSALSLGITTAANAAVATVSGSASGVSVNLRTLLGSLAVIRPTPTVTLPATGSTTPVYESTSPVILPGLVSTGPINVQTLGTPGPNGFAAAGNEIAGLV